MKTDNFMIVWVLCSIFCVPTLSSPTVTMALWVGPVPDKQVQRLYLVVSPQPHTPGISSHLLVWVGLPTCPYLFCSIGSYNHSALCTLE